MAKSITQALVGILVRQGRIDLHAPAAVPEWQRAGDPRRDITLDQLLKMRSGLQFAEDYVDGVVSDVIPMLNFEAVSTWARSPPRNRSVHAPGSFFSYSSGTTNIICRILRDIVGGPTQMLAFMTDELFEPIGMRTPLPKFDRSGTFVGSSYCLASPQDFARFGYLYLRDGVWDGRRILPEGWVDYARSPSHVSDIEAYGAHWWLTPGTSRFFAGGYDGQRIFVDAGTGHRRRALRSHAGDRGAVRVETDRFDGGAAGMRKAWIALVVIAIVAAAGYALRATIARTVMSRGRGSHDPADPIARTP